jgi:hypothetical protein
MQHGALLAEARGASRDVQDARLVAGLGEQHSSKSASGVEVCVFDANADDAHLADLDALEVAAQTAQSCQAHLASGGGHVLWGRRLPAAKAVVANFTLSASKRGRGCGPGVGAGVGIISGAEVDGAGRGWSQVALRRTGFARLFAVEPPIEYQASSDGCGAHQ